MFALRFAVRSLDRAQGAERRRGAGWGSLGCASFLLVAAGCAPEPRTPDQVALECERAVVAGDVSRALACVPEGSVDESEARALVARDAGEHGELLRELEAGEYSLELRVRALSGAEYVLALEDDRYRVDSVFGLDLGERTVDATLARLERSLVVLREEELLSLLVPERHEALAAYVGLLRKGLAERATARIVDLGDRVVVRLAGAIEIRLRRVDGRFLVEEIE